MEVRAGTIPGEPRSQAYHSESFSVSLEHLDASEIGLNSGVNFAA